MRHDGSVLGRAQADPTARAWAGASACCPACGGCGSPSTCPASPTCNAWALAAGDGIVLVDTGMHDRGTMAHLEQALDRTGHRVSDIQLIVITHAHIDHCGQAPPLAERAGCEVWMHPNWKLHAHDDLDKTIEIALLSGVPEQPLRALGGARAAGWAAARPARSTPTRTSSPGSRSRPTPAPGT